MTPILLAFILRLVTCLAVAGAFCVVTWLLNLCGLCEAPSWRLFVAAAVFVYVLIVIRDTYLYLKKK